LTQREKRAGNRRKIKWKIRYWRMWWWNIKCEDFIWYICVCTLRLYINCNFVDSPVCHEIN
jgi:hypothetical protein